jgi:hypothetical protein
MSNPITEQGHESFRIARIRVWEAKQIDAGATPVSAAA